LPGEKSARHAAHPDFIVGYPALRRRLSAVLPKYSYFYYNSRTKSVNQSAAVFFQFSNHFSFAELPLPELAEALAGAETSLPYKGGKLHYVLDMENRELVQTVVGILEPIT